LKKLERSLGLTSVIAISLSTMLGSGIFVLPGLAAAKTGPSVWLAYILAGVCVIPAALSKSELATAMPRSGGTYVYLYRTFGPLAGTISGLGLWVSLLLKSSFALVGFSAYTAAIAPDLPAIPTALTLLCAVTLLNVVGIGKVSKAQIFTVGLSITGLAVLVVLAADHFPTTSNADFLSEGTGGLISTAAFVFISYAGVTKVAALAEEVQDPGRNLPRGIISTVAIAIALYGIVTFAMVKVVPAEELHNNLRPVFVLATHLGGSQLGVAAAVLSILTMTAMATAGLLASSRFPFAMSRNRILPTWLARVHPGFKTPIPAILMTAIAMAIAIIFLDAGSIAKLASSFQILVYMAENLAVIVLRESHQSWYKPSYRSPLYPWIPIAGLLTGLMLLIALGVFPAIGAAVISMLGLVLYLAYSRKRTDDRGVLAKIGPRVDLHRPSEAPFVQVEDDHDDDAAVVVALFGKERSPDALIDVARALADGRKIHVTHVTEFEPEIELEAMLEEDAEVHALRRRVQALAEDEDVDLQFHAIASHDLVRTVHAVTARVHCQWLVMQWHGRPRRSLTSLSPIGWLINHLQSNLAMVRDRGVRIVREILVCPAPGPHDALIVSTANELALIYGARVTLARFVPNDAPEKTVESEDAYLEQLAGMCTGEHSRLLIRGGDAVSSVSEACSRYDLLVIGAPTFSLRNALFGSTVDRITARATCSVLMVKTPRVETHRAYSKRPQTHTISDNILDYVPDGAVEAKLQLRQKSAVFSHFAQRFSKIAPEVSHKTILDAFHERERIQNTSVGRGVALPHASVPELAASMLGVFVLEKAVDYEAPDGCPVDVLFATIGPPADRNTHLKLLSGVARMTLKTDLLARLREADGPSTITTALASCWKDALRKRQRPRSDPPPEDSLPGDPD
jgi:amino acid transporter/mannitol/fructose-specific phosphotransferase system IIA component (Ntr-type)/nucleotide-binding universal stress UspA family protein